ncbi:MAG: DUF4131 domain-containing protein [Phycisphaerales bacterium]|nr:DUF4131 domain-containing protein [Phycisphaerales bacterium]
MNGTPAHPLRELNRPRDRPPGAIPLGPPAIGLAIGVAIDNWRPLPIWLTLAVLFGVALSLFVRSIRIHSAVAVSVIAAVLAGAALHDRFTRRAPADHLVHHVGDEPQLLRIHGTVVSPPRQSSRITGFFARWIHQSDSTRFTLSASRLDRPDGSTDVTGLVDVSVGGPCPKLEYGSHVRLFGMAQRPSSASNPGGFDFARWLGRQGVFVTLHCKNPDAVIIESVEDDGWRGWLGGLRSAARALLLGPDLEHQPDRDGFLETLVLGWRYSISDHIEQQFRRTGTTHILAVSGSHVGVIAWFVWAMTRACGASRRWSAATVLVATILYACVVDPRPPVLRAMVIAFTLCVGMMLRRRTNALNSLALAACILIILRPTVVFEPGCQMSFAGVAAMFCLEKPLIRAFEWPVRRRWPWLVPNSISPTPPPGFLRFLRSAYYRFTRVSAIGVAATLACIPLIAFHFGRIAPLTPVNTLLLAPFFTLTLTLSVLAMVIGFVLPILAPAARFVADASAGVMLTATDIVDRINPSVSPRWNDIAVIAYTVLLVVVIAAAPFRGKPVGTHVHSVLRAVVRTRVRRIGTCAAVVLATVFIIRTLAPGSRGDARSPELRVTLLDVGRGTAAVIQFPNDTVWLYDCGTGRSQDVAERVILPFCRHAGITRIDRIVISHPNLDHYGGLFTLLDNIECGPVVLNQHFRRFANPGGPADALLAELGRRRHPTVILPSAPAGWCENSFSHPSSQESLPAPADAPRVELLWPPADLPAGTDVNDSSTVLLLSYGLRSVLLCGDIEHHAISALLGNDRLRADALVMPHHGSYQSNTAEFLASVDPRVCVQSSDRPTARLSRRYRDALGDRPLFNTADSGAVRVVITPSALTVAGHRGRRASWPSRP